MSVGNYLKGKSSHDALVHIQDVELRLLDTIHHFISMHFDNDKKYIAGLSEMLALAQKFDTSEFRDCCNVSKAWDVILQETDKLIQLLKSNTDQLQTSTIKVLSQLINDKNQAKKKYLDDRNSLESEFNKVKDEMNKCKAAYSKSMEELNVDKADFLDLKSKGEPGPKIDDAMAKFFHSTVHMHKLHNDFVISINKAKEHHTMLWDTALQDLLNCHKKEQEDFVNKTQLILKEYLTYTNTCSADFQAARQNMSNAVNEIQEYSSTFVDLYKSSPPPPIEFDFDEKLFDGYSGSLKAITKEVNDLTVELLQDRLSKLTQEITGIKEKLSTASSGQQEKSTETNNVCAHGTDNGTAENVSNYVPKRSELENCSREILELGDNFKKLETLAAMIQRPLDYLGSSQAPPASDIHDIVEGDSGGSASSTLSISPEHQQDSAFMKVTKMNPCEKNAKDGNNLSMTNSESNNDEDKPSPGHEKHEISVGASNSKMSMSKLREQGQPVDMTAPEAISRIEDEMWYHGILPREEVERLLVNDGDFLVRESKNKDTSEPQYILSVFWQSHRHFIIHFRPDKGWHWKDESYPTIQVLVRQLYASVQAISNTGVILKTPILREWELLNDDIELTEKIGAGNFGEVFKGIYKKTQEVAVKTRKDTMTEEQMMKFLQEGRILKKYNHPNIVKYIGIAAQKHPVMFVMEFIPKGDLLSYIHKHGGTHSAKEKVQMCVDVASGMEYLEERGCIHRDLAARNCLVGDNNVIKISEFGMSREEEVYSITSANSQVPVKWTAPEALNFSKYTSLCDVWSFGVLVWEIFSNGKAPYLGMTHMKARLWIEEGNRMAAPPGTPEAVYTLMMECWEWIPEKRPHFSTILKTLKDIKDRTL